MNSNFLTFVFCLQIIRFSRAHCAENATFMLTLCSQGYNYPHPPPTFLEPGEWEQSRTAAVFQGLKRTGLVQETGQDD